ncbi:MAG: phosphoribosylformylglycinamidine synthase subunit PurL [Planctomycetaceae bacterium]|jgi:phosphoribosylformylglycinamidine synthase|nr:phosphoribosylformylglycinamidine synthase subunit PurL [Planctomycetaceae bacterium]
MLWEIDIFPRPGEPDRKGNAVAADAADLGITGQVNAVSAHGYLVQGNISEPQVRLLAEQLFADSVAERFVIAQADSAKLLVPLDSLDALVSPDSFDSLDSSDLFGSLDSSASATVLSVGTLPAGTLPAETLPAETLPAGTLPFYVLPKPGVTDPVAESAMKAIQDFGIDVEAVRTFRKYWIAGTDSAGISRICAKLLANDAIEQTVLGALPFERLDVGSDYRFELVAVPLRTMNDSDLTTLSKKGQLYLSLAEMQTIRAHFVEAERDPTDLELETIAQTWSEHCSHKTLAGRIHYKGAGGEKQYENMLKETIFAATRQIRETRGGDDLCVSVFVDNAGVVRFDDEYNVCFKVETHNHPSALEPYGGANTGIGGVIRDTMGVGMSAKPICSTDVFCFGRLDCPQNEIPPGILHPRRIMRGVVAGVRDYGNRMGIPTINGAVYFDSRYLGNPLVYCGSVGILPRDMSFNETKPNDLIVAIGGRTGRDGIHGATFSSAELTSESDSISGGAVQIGNAITEKMVLDVLLEARDRHLFHAVTDCGAGGFSSAVGEMGEKIGAEVDLENAPLKYQGLNYTEIWISEAQERMVLAVPPEKWDELKQLCAGEGVEAVVLGTFCPTGRLHLKYHGTTVADLDMRFLHNGRPHVVRDAFYEPPSGLPLQKKNGEQIADKNNPKYVAFEENENCYARTLLRVLASPNVASKYKIVRQYDHEVQGGSVIKPLVGNKNDGPGDASVIRPRLDSTRGLTLACGMNPCYGDYDTYWMAASAVDESIRNCVAVGTDPSTIVLLDNFCWGNTERAETLGSLVRAAQACHDFSIAFGTPFVSGKDSLNNEFRPEGCDEPISIPPSLLVSAMGQIENIAQCVTMDLKTPENYLYLVGRTFNELGGSHLSLVNGLEGGNVPKVDAATAKNTFEKLHAAIRSGVVRSCHDLSEGGLAVALAEMCFAGGLGADVSLDDVPHEAIPADENGKPCNSSILFSESNSRFLCEVTPENAEKFETFLHGVAFNKLGVVTTNHRLVIRANNHTVINQPLDDLKFVWMNALEF